MIPVTSTVSPRTKSNTRTLGVTSVGSPSCDTLGAPSSSVIVSVAGAGSSASPLALFPNPTTATATLTGAPAQVAVQVLDALGRMVYATTTTAAGTASLDLPAGLPKGIYIVRAGTQAARLTVE